ncbi:MULTISPECIES: tagatose 1,6-diphosphate aldolase [unclassified Ruegeria]|uniref:tagatose 1,6-diphosphate aldolase n=1 Tax=unclassified Ruegeria TaxID=2625375 RepID=UPI001487FC8C|nr:MULTISPECIES: tagatose 1,6-diphosphate aldolase [unclassified Ruegeria]
MSIFDDPVYGVAVDQGSGLEAALRKVRGSQARPGDLLDFKRITVETLSPFATTMLVDASLGRELLPSFDTNCVKMLAYEADVYHISDDDRMTKLPDNLSVADYPVLGAEILKFFLYYGPNDPAELNQRKQELVAQIGAACREHGVTFLFEPLVYDRAIPDSSSAEYAIAKPGLVGSATRTFAAPEFNIDVLKVEIPINIAKVGSAMSEAEAMAAFREAAAAAGDIPLLYLSAGVTFEQFRDALALSRKAGVNANGFMCGRAIWSDAIDIFGAEGPAAMARWMQSTGRERLDALKDALT